MSQPTVDTCTSIRAVIWQDTEECPGEPAVVVKYYAGNPYAGNPLIAVGQEGKEIILNPTTIPVLIRELRKLHKEATG